MTILKLIGGFSLIVLGIWVFNDSRKDKKRDNDPNPEINYYRKLVTFRGYLFAISLIVGGLGLILSCFYQASEPQVLDDGKVIIWQK